uniref:Uncharacterized protein n=1 Tax=Tetraselmis chuii TaxID=63592 RepID=A0A7S1SL78_9CHLO|mmetsp:Transcript_18123/g.32282  ORF Transcript_18123/g.32282 Transcript_18123/m.32282 type:complete len:284 (+) Transcript_18123:266-1117(+)
MSFDFQTSMESPDFTFSYSKFSCVAEMYLAHVFFCYAVFITGLLAMIVRLVPAVRWMHIWLGRAYIHAMLWATATSLLINNTGLPAGVLISFVWVMGGLSIGWVVINIHQCQMERQALRRVQARVQSGEGKAAADLAGAIAAEKGRIAEEKGWAQRVFSWKALHGSLFFTSWLNIAGRLFVTGINPDEWVCYTYPFYKPVDSKYYNGAGNATMVPVPIHDPNYSRLPWAKTGLLAWGLIFSVGSVAACFLVGALYSFVATRRMGSSQARYESQPALDAAVTGE